MAAAILKVFAILLAAAVLFNSLPAASAAPPGLVPRKNSHPVPVGSGSLFSSDELETGGITAENYTAEVHSAASFACDTVSCPVGGFPCGGSGSQCNIGGCNCMPTSGLSTGACYYNLIYCSSTPGGGGGYFVPYIDSKSSGSSSYHARLYSVRLHVVPSQSGVRGWSTCFMRQGATGDGCACLCKMLIRAAPFGYSGCQCFYAPGCRA